MKNAANKTVILGNEWDSVLRAKLRAALMSLGAAVTNQEWAIGGSQEIEELDVAVGDHQIKVQAETYIGLSISGPPELVDRVSALILPD